MSWLICGICGLIMGAAMVFFSTKFKGFWRGWYLALAVIDVVSGVLDFIFREDYSKTTLIINLVCTSIIVVMVIVYLILDLKIKRLEKQITENEKQIAENEKKAAETKKKIIEALKDEVQESEWGWESEFLKVEFIDSQFRNDFDAEVQKIKEKEEYQENLEDAVSAIWQLIENCDSEGMKYDEDDLQRSIWDYLQE